ncbi:MAG: hypothetical protein F6K47_38730, partial [Symploca sp. SIO2E6]|nr:hypothetical protein [Symploca sp. SIO2E6]
EVGVVTIADREADIYDLFALPRREGSEFLIRANHDRCVKSKDGDKVKSLFSSVREAPVFGQVTLELQRTPSPERAFSDFNGACGKGVFATTKKSSEIGELFAHQGASDFSG